MPRARRRSDVPIGAGRSRGRSRHGRTLRSPVTGPQLPLLVTRNNTFELTLLSTVDYLRALWGEDLDGVRFDVASMPASAPSSRPGADVPRWSVDRRQRRIVLYRVPIQRMGRAHPGDEAHQKLVAEGCVFRAVAELLGRDPWELAPDRYRHF